MPLNIALINSNRIKPPIGPLGLEYLAEVLAVSGHNIEILDLCWENDWCKAINKFFNNKVFNLVGITLRNTDDCYYPSCQSFIPEFCDLVKSLRKHTDALIVIGGVGFSVMPELILDLCQADAGIYQDGEFAISELAAKIESGQDWISIPNLIWKSKDGWRRNPPKSFPLANLPTMSRNWVNNQRYFKEGGQAGIETKRGCLHHCIYCVEPSAKGKYIRTRPINFIADEFQRLLEQGIDHIYICDSEFNLPDWHASQLCEELISRGLGDKLRWYAYCLPIPFSPELANLMRRAGCVGINFGVDSGDSGMLQRLKRGFIPNDIYSATQLCKKVGIRVLLDLLLGSPGETNQSITTTIEYMKRCNPDRIGITLGIRVYPGTALANFIIHKDVKDGIIGGENPTSPIFFIDPAIMTDAFDLVNKLIRNDNRFFFLEYNSNRWLLEAINNGYRGAFWDILHRYALSKSISIDRSGILSHYNDQK